MTPETLARIHAASFVTPRPWSAAEFADLLAGRGCFLIARDGGFVLGRAIADEAELLTIAVAPEARRKGLGRALLTGFEAEAAARGAATAFLEVAETNAPARTLYLAADWRESGRRPRYYHPPEGAPIDAIVMTRALVQPKN